MNKQPFVLLTDAIAPSATALMAARAHVEIAKDKSEQGLIDAARLADVIVVRSPLPPALFEQATRLRGVVRHGAGIDMIPVDAASRHGVAVANVPGGNAGSVAEYAIGQMLNLSHKFTHIDKTLRQEGWSAARALSDNKVEIEGQTLGIVGIGQIGQNLARKAHHGFNMNVIAYRPSGAPSDSFVEMVDLPALFERSDFIVLACPLNEKTKGLVDASLLARMKPTACLINVSRGGVIDEPALIDVLSKGHIRGAALDVFTTSPLPASSPLLQLGNVLVTSHIAGITKQSMQCMGEGAAKQVLQILDGQLPEHLWNSECRDEIVARFERLS
ncbi:hydroxyacid dehydrogenase [Pusillimonas sp. ANT_WB101]|uniref:hydroxyacid dehydrogenase n=1 Tax=Pusillimonas sp. ANT_WB101 TaxID=2597356 RepID=UPI0011F08CAF|nr:hydroxyacid dehydrogenase [Pusillimonas sp. ANT_WB101]KAA0911305.1 hydroxyacid dehydrogenase [Pusillimonas sp. ANT_WB101]